MKLPAAIFPLLLTACATVGGGIGGSPTLPAPDADPRIFTKYDAKGMSARSRGWVSTIDTTGIALDESRTCTLITPRHVVMARHFQRPPGSSVTFHDAHGVPVKRMLTRVLPCTGDVAVGLLDEPVPSKLRVYPLPSPSLNTASLIGKPVLVTDQKRCIFFHKVHRIGNGIIVFQHDTEKQHGWNKKLIVGDSGNPSFIIAGGQLVLVETHTTGGPGAGPYYGDPAVQASIRNAIATLDPTYQIRTVSF